MGELPNIIARYISAYNDMDVSGMLDCLAEGVEFKNISGGQVDTHITSKKEFESLASMGISAFESRHQSVVQSISVSNLTLVKIDYKATVANDLPNGWKAGQALNFSGASAFEITGDKISKIIDES